MWLMAIAWPKDLNDILFQEYSENENQGEFECLVTLFLKSQNQCFNMQPIQVIAFVSQLKKLHGKMKV